MIGLVLGGAVLVTLGALLVRGLFLGYPPPVLPSSILSAKEQALVGACADALFPENGPIPLSGTEAGLVAYMDRYLRRVPPTQRALIRLLFRFVELGPWLFGPRHARFTRLSLAERVVVLEGMATSSIYFRRIAFVSTRTMLTMGYLADARVARHVGIVCSPAPFEERPPEGPPASSAPRPAQAQVWA